MNRPYLFIKLLVLFCIVPLTLSGQNLTDEQGYKTGPWKVNYPNGKLRYEATFDQGLPVGLMKRYNDKGELMAEMNFIPNTTRCYAKHYGGGKLLKAKGLYINQKKDSVWTYYRSNKTISLTESYKDGLLSGPVISYYPGGSISQEYIYLNGKKHGQWKQLFEDGKIMQRCNYTNDMLNGHYEAYYPEGQLEVEGGYIRNKLDGDWNYYTEEGELKQVLKYRMGEIQNPEDLQENYDKFIKHVEDNIGNIPDPDNGGSW